MQPVSPTYSFLFKKGGSIPEAHLSADNDDHFFNFVLPAWEQEKGFEHVRGTVVCTMTEYRRVPEPGARHNGPRPEYLLHAKKMADPSKPFAY